MKLKFLLPLPPSVNNQYRTGGFSGDRRFLTAEARHYRALLNREFQRLYVKGLLSGEWRKHFEDKFITLRCEFYFPTPFRRDLDGGLKIAQDAVCEGLRVNDNRVVDIHLIKRLDKRHPRLVMTVEILDTWDFEGESSLFFESEETPPDETINLLDDFQPLDASAVEKSATPALASVAAPSKRNGKPSTGKFSTLEQLMERFNW